MKALGNHNLFRFFLVLECSITRNKTGSQKKSSINKHLCFFLVHSDSNSCDDDNEIKHAHRNHKLCISSVLFKIALVAHFDPFKILPGLTFIPSFSPAFLLVFHSQTSYKFQRTILRHFCFYCSGMWLLLSCYQCCHFLA